MSKLWNSGDLIAYEGDVYVAWRGASAQPRFRYLDPTAYTSIGGYIEQQILKSGILLVSYEDMKALIKEPDDG